jgi:hypothetical protein
LETTLEIKLLNKQDFSRFKELNLLHSNHKLENHLDQNLRRNHSSNNQHKLNQRENLRVNNLRCENKYLKGHTTDGTSCGGNN